MGYLKITNQKTGEIVYSTHKEVGRNDTEYHSDQFNDKVFSFREESEVKLPLEVPYEKPGFSLKAFAKAVRDEGKDE